MVPMNDIITVIGNVASDPEVVATASGRSLTRLRIAATHRRFNPESKQWEDAGTNWYNVRAWGRLAEHVRASVTKGMQLVVHGRLKIETRKGETATFTNVDIDADSIGVSLQFGIVSFQRGSGAAADAVRQSQQHAPNSVESAATAPEPEPEPSEESASEPAPWASTAISTPF